MNSYDLSSAIPQLPSGNIEKTAKFFEEFLGFEIADLYKEHNFLIVKKGLAEIHFWKAEDETAAKEIGRVSSCYIRVKNIEQLFQEIKSKNTNFRYELTKMPWGMNEFQVDDPYGNAIKFGEILQ